MKKCACGCGLEVRNEKNKYIHNHHMRGVPGWNKGKKNPEHSKRMKGEGNPMYGKKRPELSGDLNPAKRPEVRAKISKTLMGHSYNKGYIPLNQGRNLHSMKL